MRVYVSFNKQRTKEDGMIPIYIVVYRPSLGRVYINTGLSSSVVFDNEIFPRTERNAKAKTIALAKMIEDVERVALGNSLLRNDELKAKIMKDALGEKETFSLSDMFDKYIETKKDNGGKRIYQGTLSAIKRYCKETKTTMSLELTEDDLDSFCSWLGKSVCRNTIAIRTGNIRTVINYARKKGFTSCDVFRDYKIKREETRKRNLSIDDIRRIRDYEVSPKMQKYVDSFMLMFYFIGINPADLFNLRKSDVVDGRVEYIRKKTGRLYSIKIEPEAKAILDKYSSGKTNLLDFTERISFLRLTQNLNNLLGSIKSGVTAYYARHSWATIAISLDIPIEVISAALGHSIGSKTTNIYVEIKQNKVDAANRKVLDSLL